MDGLNSFEINRLKKQEEEMAKAVQRGIAIAQHTPESIETFHHYGAGVIQTEEGQMAIVLCLASGRQVRILMQEPVRRSLARELSEGLEEGRSSDLEIPGS